MGLYEEALVDAKKLKELAEADAKRAIVEELTPFIRKTIASSVASKHSFLFEEEEPETSVAPIASDPTAAAPAAIEPSADATAMAAPITPTGAETAPIQAVGADTLNMPMPGADGKLVVDFDDMFVPSEPGDDSASGLEGPASAELAPEVPGGIPSAEPVDVNPLPAGAAPAQPTMPPEPVASTDVDPALAEPVDADPTEPKMETYELFNELMETTLKRINRVYEDKKVPVLMKEALQAKLFALIESLETLTEKQIITENLSKIIESRLEISHLKLQEAFLGNSYEDKGNNMANKSLKEFAASMLAESDTIKGGPIKSPADSFKNEKTMSVQNSQNAAADKAGEHAKKVTEPTVTLKTEAAELAKLEEELKALLENPGDSLVAEPGKEDLAGAASTIPDKKVGEVDPTKSTAASPTNPASHVQGVKEGAVAVSGKALKEETKKLKAESLRKQISALQEQLKECGMEETPLGDSPVGDGGVTLNFNIDLADLVGGLGDVGPDDEIEIVDDEPELPASEPSGLELGGGDEPEDVSLKGDSEPTKPEEEEEPKSDLPLSEGKRARQKADSKILSENRDLKARLEEQKVFNAKVVHFQPFLNDRNLTKEQKQKIVECLDRGKTVSEVKSIYGSVKVVLENARKAKAKAGSSSKPVGSGAAKLNESVESTENLYEGATLVAEERNRLMELAGIRRK